MHLHAQSGSVGIRRFQPDDAPLLFAAIRESIVELCQWMYWCHPDYSLKDTEDFISLSNAGWEKRQQYDFAIVDPKDATLLGAVGLNQINRIHNFANLGYWVRSNRTRQGIAPAATRLVAQFGLQELRFTRLEIVAAVGNTLSQRVAEKAGAKREGVLRNGLRQNGNPYDAIMYSLIPDDL